MKLLKFQSITDIAEIQHDVEIDLKDDVLNGCDRLEEGKMTTSGFSSSQYAMDFLKQMLTFRLTAFCLYIAEGELILLQSMAVVIFFPFVHSTEILPIVDSRRESEDSEGENSNS